MLYFLLTLLVANFIYRNSRRCMPFTPSLLITAAYTLAAAF